MFGFSGHGMFTIGTFVNVLNAELAAFCVGVPQQADQQQPRAELNSNFQIPAKVQEAPFLFLLQRLQDKFVLHSHAFSQTYTRLCSHFDAYFKLRIEWFRHFGQLLNV